MKKIVLLLGLILLAGNFAQAIMVKVDMPVLVADATNVITGKVISVTSHYTETHKSIYTIIDVAVTSELAGSTRASEIAIRQNGGAMPDLGLAIEDSAVFQAGEEVILFLVKNSDGTYQVWDMHQGKYTVADNTVVENGEPVSQFIAEIQAAVGEGK